MAKYLSKGVTPEQFEPARAAELLRSWAGKRVMTASRGYFAGFARDGCAKCGQKHRPGSAFDAFKLRVSCADVASA